MPNPQSEISPQRFSKAEVRVITLLLEGKSTKQIALRLNVSTRAVEQHLTHIYEKLRVCSRSEAIIILLPLFRK